MPFLDRNRRADAPSAAPPASPSAPPPAPPTEDPEELIPLPWYAHADALAAVALWKMARRLPGLVTQAMRLAWQASRRDTTLAIGLNLAAGVLTALGLLATTGVATALLATGPTPDRLRASLPALSLVAGATAARSGLTSAAGWAQARLTPQVTAVVEWRLYDLTTSVELSAFDDAGFADDMERASTRGTDSAAMLTDHVVDFITGLVGLAAVGVTLTVLHPLLLPLLVVAALPVGWAAVRSARQRYLSLHQRVTRRRRVWMLQHLMANRQTAAEVRANTMAGFLLNRYRRVVAVETAADLDVVRQQTLTRLAGAALGGLATTGVYVVLGALILRGAVPLAAAATAVLALQHGGGAMRILIMAANGLYEDGLYFADYTGFLQRAAERRPAADQPAPDRFTEIALDRVSFHYPEAERPAVDEVSLSVRRGQTIALVGENGSGKTSLARLIAALYRPDSGQIRWDGRDVSDADPEQLRQHIGVITQEYWHWPFTARTNIVIGRHTRADGDPPVFEAARAADAHQMIVDLPNGYHTLLDRMFAGGHELSGGQWQRLAAARGFYREPALLICDEPSASLDARAEHAIFQQLRTGREHQAIVLITHRLANIRHADLIYVLHEGRVVEQGTHGELMSAGGTYAELFELQASGYLAGTGQPDRA
ncbi:MAG: ABC transporter ATP-binding protein/permease [Sporichthyaceae bacterium]|nr:ABC transporter ATP-binding protein/permease [Sporichthyaceae bacterium]